MHFDILTGFYLGSRVDFMGKCQNFKRTSLLLIFFGIRERLSLVKLSNMNDFGANFDSWLYWRPGQGLFHDSILPASQRPGRQRKQLALPTAFIS